MATFTVSGKAVGRRRPLFADWSIPLPPEWHGGVTLRQLIAGIVRTEIAAFRQRQEERQVFHALTARQIAAGAEKGKIEMGGRETEPQEVDEEAAVAAALQAFQDGLYLVVVDEQEQQELDQAIPVRPDSRVTFIRLTLLAGG
jgi:hypothetical protein